MKRKILVAVDSSECSLKGARYVADLLGNCANVSVTLFHVLLSIPPYLLECGSLHVKEKLDRERAEWKVSEHNLECKCFEPIIEILKKGGFRDDQIETKHFAPLPGFDVAHVILEECKQGNYDTVVMGKRGLSPVKHFLTGSVTEKVVRHAKDMAVWVVE